MGCTKSTNVNRNAVQRPQAAAANNNGEFVAQPRTVSQLFRNGELPDEMNSADLMNLIPLMQQLNNNQLNNEEGKDNVGGRAANYLDNNQDEGFEGMLRRLSEQRMMFYKKFGREPLSKHSQTSSEIKINQLREKLKVCQISFTQGCNVLEIDRDNVIEDSIDTFMEVDHQKELKIVFKGETKDSGQDAGGMEKEWFNLIWESLLDEDTGMFRTTNTDEVAYTICEESNEIDDYLKSFEFFGVVLAKAIFDEIPLNLWLSKIIFRLLLNPDALISLDDIKNYDIQVYNSLKYLQDTEIDSDEYLEFYFQHEHNGEMHPLTPDGTEIEVTDDNKAEYIVLKTEFMVKNFITDQINAVRKGFEKLISFDLISNFTEDEFLLLWCGESKIDLEEWKRNTLYAGIYQPEHEVIKWFWDYMTELEQESLRIIFQFVTGMSRLPAGGFSWLNKNRGERQYFTIRSVEYFEASPFPKAYTCFNRMHLPTYPDEETLRENIDFIIDQKEVYGFGLED